MSWEDMRREEERAATSYFLDKSNENLRELGKAEREIKSLKEYIKQLEDKLSKCKCRE